MNHVPNTRIQLHERAVASVWFVVVSVGIVQVLARAILAIWVNNSPMVIRVVVSVERAVLAAAIGAVVIAGTIVVLLRIVRLVADRDLALYLFLSL